MIIATADRLITTINEYVPVALSSSLLTSSIISVDDMLLSITINIAVEASSTLYDDLLNWTLTAIKINVTFQPEIRKHS